MERIDGQEPLDGEQEDDPWAGHPASRWAEESEGESRPAAGEQPTATQPEAISPEPGVIDGEAEAEPVAVSAWDGYDDQESSSLPAGEADSESDTPEPTYERAESSGAARDRWQPDAYEEEPLERPAMKAGGPRTAGRSGSWLIEDEAPEGRPGDDEPAAYGRRGTDYGRGRDDWEDDGYRGTRVPEGADEDSQPAIVRSSPWQPADTFADRRPWEASDDAEGEGGDGDGRRRPRVRSGQMAAQHGPQEEPVVVMPVRIETPTERRHRYRTLIREVVETGLLAILVFLSVRASFQNFKVDGASMQPTLENGQFLIVNKLIYSEIDLEKLGTFFPFIDGGEHPKRNVFHGPERGDIVVLQDPRSPDTDLIKRIIGLPGETLEIVDGKVFVNDFLLEEPYITSEWNDTRPKIAIPQDYYFVMGDNRENSLDSRSQQVGLIHKDLIIGKAMFSYWPTGKFGLTPNGSGTLTDEERPVLSARRIEEFVQAN